MEISISHLRALGFNNSSHPLLKTQVLCFIITMKSQNAHRCPSCSSSETTLFRMYNTVHNGSRRLIRCETCNRLFAETINSAMENLKTPISKVASALLLRSEGLAFGQPVGYWNRIRAPLPAGSNCLATRKKP